MRARLVAVVAALLSWGVAVAQVGLPPGANAPPPGAPPQPDQRADIWQRMTPDQRKQLWQQLTPEERSDVWRRLSPEQRQAIRERLTPEERRAIRDRWFGRTLDAGPGPKLTPDERRRLRDAIREAHPEPKRRPGR